MNLLKRDSSYPSEELPSREVDDVKALMVRQPSDCHQVVGDRIPLDTHGNGWCFGVVIESHEEWFIAVYRRRWMRYDKFPSSLEEARQKVREPFA